MPDLFKEEWQHIFYDAIEHMDSLHLYYNMVSFIWKGINLEEKLITGNGSFVGHFAGALAGLIYLAMLKPILNVAWLVVVVDISPRPGARFVGAILEIVLLEYVLPDSSAAGHTVGFSVELMMSYVLPQPLQT
ncbi:hypothetical protein MRX96_012247 [Rhipicephalus microplus]